MQKAKILIVEDEPIVALSLRMQLQRNGYRIVGVVDSSYEALECIEKDRPDLILMDYNIRGAMNGIDTAQIIHLRNKIPIVFLSSLDNENIIRRIRALENCSFMPKPVDINNLKRVIDQKVRKSRPDLGQVAQPRV